MNTTAIRLVFVETNTVFDVMCKILTVVAFLNAHALILLSLAANHYRSSSLQPSARNDNDQHASDITFWLSW